MHSALINLMNGRQNLMTRTSCDVCIVGAGAAGSVVAAHLAKAGLNVFLLDAGPLRDPQQDFASDELEMEKLFWDEPRISEGQDPLDLYRSTSGKGVGGSAVHYTAQLLRFHPTDFQTKTSEQIGEDWPISYQDVEPYYKQMTKTLCLSGPSTFPWKKFGNHFPYPAHHDLSNNTLKFREGLERAGYQHSVSPLAILSAPKGDRHPCINRGFCEEGCMPDAKTTPLNTFIPEGLKAGVTLISEATAYRITTNEEGKATSVLYILDGKHHEIEATTIVLAAYAIETPRLLLASASESFPNGLANSSGLVGKYLLTNMNDHVLAIFPEEIRMYRGNPVQALTLDTYLCGRNYGFKRGFLMNSYGLRPIRLATLFFENDTECVGERLRERMLDYNHYVSIAMLGEVIPQHHNAVTLSDQKDKYGCPIPKVTFSHHQNDESIREKAKDVMKSVLKNAGGTPLYHLKAHAHLMGGCRMGNNSTNSVVTSYGQTHDVDNLFVVGSPTFVTAPSANPTLTVYSLAQRSAEYIETYTKQAKEKNDSNQQSKMN
ncbi:NAD(P)-binding protein [Pontibacillus yanchengensis]|uniref:NAD(P)-binding protein n=2 Tax=Pontibacillus yanchengensis TaxID=462910 RepID=A0A6I4ZXA1_9BACI|nr:NAD(P)-binding protein [Pontibacillus yanchengensis]